MKKPAGIFLDRDGLINIPPPIEQRYICHPSEFHLMPGIAESIRQFNLQHIPVAVVTNQKGVAIGSVSESTLADIHKHMLFLLEKEHASIQHIQYCPHQESDRCSCRKPLPGMIFSAAHALKIDPSACWMIGDQFRDLEAGRAAGCSTLLVGPESPPAGLADHHIQKTEDLPAWIQENFSFQTER